MTHGAKPHCHFSFRRVESALILLFFLGSCKSIRLLASQLLSKDCHEITFPDEDDGLACLITTLGSIWNDLKEADECSSNQTWKQHDTMTSFFATASIRDQACLTVLSHFSGASSGWLKAIPQLTCLV